MHGHVTANLIQLQAANSFRAHCQTTVIRATFSEPRSTAAESLAKIASRRRIDSRSHEISDNSSPSGLTILIGRL